MKEKPIRGGLARLFKRHIFCFIVMVHDVTGSRKVYGTIISLSVCYWQQVDFGASIVAGGLAFAVRSMYLVSWSPLARLILETAVLSISFLGMLLFATGQTSVYLGIVGWFAVLTN